ncbi:unnamed protein product [Blepharisma stoltei]|uniref:Receptor ligand binding region domain-containing protein n=1 Tax=Blepharisma stoltei TaxID=1481888 RepID=A0AAU9JMB6_9CILI|nr:unnamed protein product [Blepharisma stoltei]
MIIFFCLLLYSVKSQIFTIPILYSQNTDTWIIDYFVKTLDCSLNNLAGCDLSRPYQYQAIEINGVSDIEQAFSNSDYLFVYDSTWSLSMSSLVSQYAIEYGFIHFIYGNTPENSLPYVFYTDYSFSQYRDFAINFAKIYGITKVIAIITSDFIGMDFTNDKGIEIVAQYTIPESVPYEYIFSLISREIKPFGVKWLFFQTNAAISYLIQQALVEADMDKEGYTYIYLQEAAWSAYLKGSILFEARSYHSTGLHDFIEKLIYNTSLLLYQIVADNNIQGSYSAYALNKYVQKIFTIDTIACSIWNIQSDGSLAAVGLINGKGLQLYDKLMFPGKTYEAPNNEKIKIPISINGENSVNQYGASFAVETIKSEAVLLPNFHIIMNNITCDFDNNSVYSCFLNHTADLGYFHLPKADTKITEETVDFFQSINVSIPVLGAETSIKMSIHKYYPQYLRVSYPNSITSSAVALVLSIFGISKCSLLYSDSQWGRDFNSQFINQTNSYGLTILNKIRVVPLGFNGTNNIMIQEIIDLKSRYIVLEIQQPDILYVIEAFYDLGMRETDIFLIAGDGMLSISDLDEKRVNADLYKKRKEIMNGLIYVSSLAFQNQIGLNIKNNFLSRFGFAYDNMCLFYDAAYLGIYAINSLINRGINLESSKTQKAMRDVKFTGCSGVVQIAQDGNDRLTTVLGIYNLIQANSTWKMSLCGLYDPSQLIVLQIKQSFWQSTEGHIPSDIIGEDQKCPFKERQVQSFIKGYFILIAIEVIPIIIGTGFVIKFSDFVFNFSIQKLMDVEKENFLDSFSYIIVLIECLQYMYTGDETNSFFPQLSDLTKFVVLDITGLSNGHFTFWNQLLFFEGISFAWFFLIFWKKYKIGENSKNCITIGINDFNMYLLPFLGDSLFLPVCLNLFQSFQCTSSIGDSFTESFHNQDCSTFCWKDKHIYYVVLSSWPPPLREVKL